jgi:hypothetical protein
VGKNIIIFSREKNVSKQGSHYFQIGGRSDLSLRELTGRSGETSGRS